MSNKSLQNKIQSLNIIRSLIDKEATQLSKKLSPFQARASRKGPTKVDVAIAKQKLKIFKKANDASN